MPPPPCGLEVDISKSKYTLQLALCTRDNRPHFPPRCFDHGQNISHTAHKIIGPSHSIQSSSHFQKLQQDISSMPNSEIPTAKSSEMPVENAKLQDFIAGQLRKIDEVRKAVDALELQKSWESKQLEKLKKGYQKLARETSQ